MKKRNCGKNSGTLARLRTVEQVHERIQGLQMRVLTRIEKQDWRGARRLSCEIGKCYRRKVQIQKREVKKLPLFAKVGGGK